MTEYPLGDPPEALRFASTDDFDEGLALIARLYCDTRQRVLGRNRRYHVDACGVEMGGLRLNRTRFGAPTTVRPQSPRPFYVVNFSPRLRCRSLADGAHVATAGGLGGVVLSPTSDVELLCTSDVMEGVVVPTVVMERGLRALLGADPEEPLTFDLALDMDQRGAVGVRRFVRLLFDLFAMDQPLLEYPLTIAAVERAFTFALLTSMRHNYSDRIEASGATLSERKVRQVELFIEMHLDEPINTNDLAAAVGQSESAIRKAFRKHREYTPMQYLRSLRMERVRDELLAAVPGTTVTRTALRWGFAHPGRFSILYRERYGESPSSTLRRLRAR